MTAEKNWIVNGFIVCYTFSIIMVLSYKGLKERKKVR